MDLAQQRAALFAKLDSLVPPSTRTPLQHDLIMANNSINLPTTPPEIQEPPAYHTVVDPNAPIPNMNNPYHPLDDRDEDFFLEEMEGEVDADAEEDDSDSDDDTIPVVVNAHTTIQGHGNIIGFEPATARKVAALLFQLMGRPLPPQVGAQQQPANAAAAPTADQAILNIPLARGKKLRVEINCNTLISGDKNVVGPGLGEIARTLAVARARQAEAARRQGGEQSPGAGDEGSQGGAQETSPSAGGDVSEGEGEGAGGMKRKADEEEVEGTPKAKRVELSE